MKNFNLTYYNDLHFVNGGYIEIMKQKLVFITILLSLLLGAIPSSALANRMATPPQVLAYDGKTFTGFQDPEYISYDQALREFLVKRIGKEFGVVLDPKKYSSFDLLEIEALFKIKKPNESFDMFLGMFPKGR
jgi:hypothetical protein